MRVEITRRMSDAEVAAVTALLDAVQRAAGHRPLSDHLWLDLTHGGRPGFVAVVARDDADDAPVAYAQVSRGNDAAVVELVVHPDRDADRAALAGLVLRAALGVVADDGGGRVHWWVFGAGADDDRLAAEIGLAADHDLHQLRRSLPTGKTVSIETRPFRVGRDEAAWLEVNNRAFAGHDEQGGWDLETIRRREAEPWFDPDGFLLHDRDGRLAGFCWTKVHAAVPGGDPELGEIYVIAVDPDFHGQGLGRALTVAGLDALARRGVGMAMLFVDADNAPAMGLYASLGFTVHRTDRAYAITVVAHATADGAS